MDRLQASAPQLTSEPQSTHRVPAPVDASDLNNARTLAILSTAPFSRVLDIGCGAGLTSRALADRGCRVWAIEKNPEAAAEAARWCEQVLTADVETLDLAGALGRERFDIILLLDVVEHLRDPQQTLAALSRVLAPGGRVIISVPNVGHAAVRLQLLTGRFARTDSGLLDRTHLHFFDRAGFYGLLASADLRVIDEMRTVRAVTETEIPVDLASFPADAVGLATRDADAETYQYVVVAVPGDGHAAGAVQGVAGALKEKIIAIEHDYHALERWARNLESQLQRRSDNETQVAAAAAAAEAALVRYEELAAAATAAGEAAVVRYEQLARDYEELAKGLLRLQEAHAGSVTALERSRVEVRCLQQDLEVKEAYLASLRDGDDARRQAAAHELSETRRLLGEAEAEIAVRDHNARLLEERLSQIESQAATGILARDENVRILQDRLSRTEAHALASARAAAELREETRGYQATLSLPRYRVADAMNRVFRLTGPIHRFAKQFVTRRGNGA